MRTHRFDTPGAVDLDATIKSGRLLVETWANPETLVEIAGSDAALVDEVTVEHEPRGDGHRVVVRIPRMTERGFLKMFARNFIDVHIKAPEQALANVSSADGEIRLDGRFCEVSASTASGAVTIDTVSGPLSVNTASGDASVESGGGQSSIRTASGTVRCGQLARADIKTASGDVQVSSASERLAVTTGSGDVDLGESVDCTLRTASGDLRVGGIHQGVADLKTASGDIVIGVVAGAAVAVDAQSVSGSLSSEIELSGTEPAVVDGDREIELVLRTVSGDIQVRRTQAYAAT